MTLQNKYVDAMIIGGGFYGAAIAIYLVKERGFRQVMLVEREPKLMNRASYNNQARIHNGYHYPRSFTTGYRSRVNLPRFIQKWPFAVKRDFLKIYAIAKRNSKVTAKQFNRFCREIGAEIWPAEENLKELFESRLIEDVFCVEEYVFDSAKLADWAVEELLSLGVDVHYSSRATAISQSQVDRHLKVEVRGESGQVFSVNCRHVFNCTYSGLNQLYGDYMGTQAKLKHEVAEMALVQLPAELRDMGITVMDGPFFSIMPFPDRGLHTLSHVRYTPHFSWEDEIGVDPYGRLDGYDRVSNIDRMIRDVGRYLPSIYKSTYIESIFEIKTVLSKNEADDGRPILFERHKELPGCYSILGGKIDNIFDVLEKIDEESF